MRKINKIQPPHSFETYVKSTNPLDHTYKPTYEGLDSNVREELQESLLNEQGGVCGYCMQKITITNMKIEHHCEQAICNGENGTIDRTIDYTNMLAVCKGDAGRKELHCDSKKSQFNSTTGLPMKVSPWEAAHMNAISFSSNGLVKSIIPLHDREIKNILSLNTPHLKYLREKKFQQIYSASSNLRPAIMKAKMRRILEDDLQKAGHKFTNSFPGMSEYMLNKYC